MIGDGLGAGVGAICLCKNKAVATPRFMARFLSK
jgi:hypothetical protein